MVPMATCVLARAQEAAAGLRLSIRPGLRPAQGVGQGVAHGPALGPIPAPRQGVPAVLMTTAGPEATTPRTVA